MTRIGNGYYWNTYPADAGTFVTLLFVAIFGTEALDYQP